jgi:hypothetical protein
MRRALLFLPIQARGRFTWMRPLRSKLTWAVLLLPLFFPGVAQGSVRFANTSDRPLLDEWAVFSCQSSERIQTLPRADDGRPSRQILLKDGDNSYGERCELSMGNAPAAAIRHVGGYNALFHHGDDLWISWQYRLRGREPYAFKFAPLGAPVPVPEEGGLIAQLKQLGSCGTPALGIIATRTSTFFRNSAQNYCESGSMKSLPISWPTRLDRWIKLTLHVRFALSSGLVEAWADVGQGMVFRGGATTHTMKSPTDHPAGACDEPTPCSHFRAGVYRDPDISGDSLIRIDNVVVATTREEAETRAFGP